MKRTLIALAVVSLLSACGKRVGADDPHLANVPQVTPSGPVCWNVEILAERDGVTLMEIEGEPPRTRINRNGHYGSPGDKFQFCERT